MQAKTRQIGVWLALLVALLWGLAAIPRTFWSTYDEELIRVAGTALSVLGAVGLWILKTNHDKARQVEQQEARQRRLLVGLRAELALNIEAHEAQYNPESSGQVLAASLANMAKAGAGEHRMPKAVTVAENTVFDSIKDEVADLPGEVIRPVIQAYFYDKNLLETLSAFSRGEFENLSEARRKAALSAYLHLGMETLQHTITAYEAVNEQLHDEPIEFDFTLSDLKTKLKARLDAA